MFPVMCFHRALSMLLVTELSFLKSSLMGIVIRFCMSNSIVSRCEMLKSFGGLLQF